MTEPPAPCRNCFWIAADIPGHTHRWCSHKEWHGWLTGQICEGEGYRPNPDPAEEEAAREALRAEFSV